MSVSDDQPHTRTRLPAGEQPMGPQAPGFGRLRMLGGVFVVVFLLVIAVAVINRTNGSPTTGPATHSNDAGTAVSPTAPTGTQPVTTTAHGIGVQYPHTSEGAQSAAANYSVALGSSEMYATASRHAIIATVADPSAMATLNSRFDASYSAEAAQFGLTNGRAPSGLTFVSRSVPVGTKIDGFTDSGATVEIWSTSIGGLAGQGSTRPVTEYWYTLTLRLVWSGNDWKVNDFSQVSGPTPISGSQAVSSYGDLASAVNQFGGFRYAR
ncbi:hypothetical protein [Streptacidiphilus jiangxiensis]|uniref:Uncharacterized protein n=1 Tax=Streptacidiphilus jiangxiensis TaxID=235985 RepID=A0A1H7Y0W7_STRJI|nr:hypothetical protein [Streptacidiphilus jiangxiensis]SEM38988.1 hypothetical protein SAMN05414137_1267 [Streptacidiphilus jiangxiensis]